MFNKAKHAEKNPKRVFTILVVLAVVALIIGIVYLISVNGSNESTEPTPVLQEVGNTFEKNEKSYVYVGATSELFENRFSKETSGRIIDIFNQVSTKDLATLIDNGGFPIAIEYKAVSNEGLYLIEITSITDGSIQSYWVKP